MAIILKEQVGPQIPSGPHLAICHRVCYLGTQPDSGFGAKPKLVLFWELPHERGTFDGKEFPLGISKIYSLGSSGGMNKKSSLRKDLASWRGRDFTADELKGFDLKNILGKACQLSVEHNDEGRAKVGGVFGIPKGTQVTSPYNPLVEYSIEQGRDEVYKRLPEWVQKMADACEEWKPESEKAKPIPAEDGQQPVDDDVPF